jgi:ribosomal protein S9
MVTMRAEATTGRRRRQAVANVTLLYGPGGAAINQPSWELTAVMGVRWRLDD